jgi:hypothetical protein
MYPTIYCLSVKILFGYLKYIFFFFLPPGSRSGIRLRIRIGIYNPVWLVINVVQNLKMFRYTFDAAPTL